MTCSGIYLLVKNNLSNQPKLVRRINYLTNFLLAVYILSLLADCISNNTTSARWLGTPAVNWLWPMMALLLIVRVIFSLKIPSAIQAFYFKLLLPFSAIFSTVLSIVDYHTPANMVFQWTRLHQESLGILAFFLVITWLINQSNKWWQRHVTKVVAVAPFVMFLSLLVVRLWPFNYFLEFVKEDHFIENTQFVVLLVGSIWLACLTLAAKQKKQYRQALLILFFAAGLFLVAGDEISWSQRVFGIQTPEFIDQHNRQGETTFHNLEAVEWLVVWGYLLISWVGLLARPVIWLLAKFWKPAKQLIAYTANWAIMGYFLFPAFFHLVNFKGGFGIWPEWSEPKELFFYLGMIFWLGQVSFHLVKQQNLWKFPNKRSS